DPAGARRRALVLRERMLRERTEQALATEAAGVLLGDRSRAVAAPLRVTNAPDPPVNGTDLTLVVTAHDETLVCGPTMRAADVAVAAARAAGYTVQTVIALDRATETTAAYFHQPSFDHWERWTMDEGELGRVRNASVLMSTGRFIAFLDADDVFSEN